MIACKKSCDISDVDPNNGTTSVLPGRQGEGQKLSWYVLVKCHNQKMPQCPCFTFQNGQFLNINFVDKNLAELKVPKELLLRVFLMRCISGRTDCNNPGSMVTDFNMWDRSLGDDELIKWTTCR